MSRILLVEDEQHLAEGLRFNLTAEHHDVQVVDSGEAALAQLTAEPARFELVILDVMLPGITAGVVADLRRAGQFTRC
jgi:DNA-binding response OmpR family regulator